MPVSAGDKKRAQNRPVLRITNPVSTSYYYAKVAYLLESTYDSSYVQNTRFYLNFYTESQTLLTIDATVTNRCANLKLSTRARQSYQLSIGVA